VAKFMENDNAGQNQKPYPTGAKKITKEIIPDEEI